MKKFITAAFLVALTQVCQARRSDRQFDDSRSGRDDDRLRNNSTFITNSTISQRFDNGTQLIDNRLSSTINKVNDNSQISNQQLQQNNNIQRVIAQDRSQLIDNRPSNINQIINTNTVQQDDRSLLTNQNIVQNIDSRNQRIDLSLRPNINLNQNTFQRIYDRPQIINSQSGNLGQTVSQLIDNRNPLIGDGSLLIDNRSQGINNQLLINNQQNQRINNISQNQNNRIQIQNNDRNVGGQSQFKIVTQQILLSNSTLNKALKFARDEFCKRYNFKLGNFRKYTQQIVSGVKYRMIFDSNYGPQTVQIQIVSQPWLSSHEIVEIRTSNNIKPINIGSSGLPSISVNPVISGNGNLGLSLNDNFGLLGKRNLGLSSGNGNFGLSANNNLGLSSVTNNLNLGLSVNGNLLNSQNIGSFNLPNLGSNSMMGNNNLIGNSNQMLGGSINNPIINRLTEQTVRPMNLGSFNSNPSNGLMIGSINGIMNNMPNSSPLLNSVDNQFNINFKPNWGNGFSISSGISVSPNSNMNIQTVSNTVSNTISTNPTAGGQSQVTIVTEDILRSNSNLANSITFARNYFFKRYGYNLGNIRTYTEQIVSGINHKLVFDTQKGQVQIIVFNQPWTKTSQITSIRTIC